MIDQLVNENYFYEIKKMIMKKIIFILFLMLGTGSLVQAQLLNKLKAKAKAATENSADRSTDKVVDKTVNQPTDKATDKALNKAGEKVNNLFKKKKKKNTDDVSAAVPASDSTVTKPEHQ